MLFTSFFVYYEYPSISVHLFVLSAFRTMGFH